MPTTGRKSFVACWEVEYARLDWDMFYRAEGFLPSSAPLGLAYTEMVRLSDSRALLLLHLYWRP